MACNRSDHTRDGQSPSKAPTFRRLLAATLTAVAALLPVANPPTAHAVPCPDVEVIFARGTFEPPGLGATGQAFVDALRQQLAGSAVEVYPVNYPASLDFARAAEGIIDASNKIRDTAASCPETEMVLGGYSQGAAVMAYITTDQVPENFNLPAGITGPMPESVAPHVAAVTLFGKPSNGFLNLLNSNAPPITIGQAYAAKTLDLCVPGDPVCSTGGDNGAHGLYAVNGMTNDAAGFVTARVAAA